TLRLTLSPYTTLFRSRGRLVSRILLALCRHSGSSMLHSSHFGSVTFSACPPRPLGGGARYARRAPSRACSTGRSIESSDRASRRSVPVTVDGTRFVRVFVCPTCVVAP